jgi:ABC-2 type transport system permease protein
MYFSTPFGFVFLGIFLLVSGVMFTVYNLLGANGNLSGTFDLIKNLSFILFPLLSMRMFAEERRLGTEQLLTTSRLSALQIVAGKYLAAAGVFLSALIVTLIYVVIIFHYGMPSAGSLAASYLGFLLLGLSMISVCMFVASFAESQITAAVSSFGVLFFMVLPTSFTKSLQIPVVTPILSAIAITTRYDEFTRGILSFGPVVYYIAIIAVMILFTVKNIQRRRFN